MAEWKKYDTNDRETVTRFQSIRRISDSYLYV